MTVHKHEAVRDAVPSLRRPLNGKHGGAVFTAGGCFSSASTFTEAIKETGSQERENKSQTRAAFSSDQRPDYNVAH